MLALGTIFSFITSNLKWVAIILATLGLLLVGWKFYSLTSQTATLRAEVTRLETQVAYKDLAIELWTAKAQSVQEALSQRDTDLRNAREVLKDLQSDLPPDASDEAPASTREFINRLKGRLP